MAVYVDALFSVEQQQGYCGWQWTQACHMFADTTAELHAFAKRIGLKRAWFQNSRHPHYDLTATKRRRALAAGAVELTEETRKQIVKRDRRATDAE